MANGPEIKVGANVQDAERSVQRLTEQLNKMGQAAAKATHTKFKPIDPKDLGDANRLEDLWKQISATQRGVRTAVAASGQNPANLWGTDFGRVAFTHAQQRGLIMRFLQGTAAYDGQFRRERPPPAPWTPGRGAKAAIDRFVSGVGGAPASIFRSASGGAAEAAAGEEGGGGLLSGAAGFLRGGLIGAGLFALFKGGQMVHHGYDDARERDMTLDSLKLQMGAVDVSFSQLEKASDLATHGLLINSKEAAALFKEFNHLSGGVRSISNLMSSTHTSVGFANAYGLNDKAAVGFFGTERQIFGGGPLETRRLALMVGDAISRSGMIGQSDKILQAIKDYTVQMSRATLSKVNVSAYAGMYSGMLSSHYPGMTPEAAQQIMSRANQSMMHMGGGANAQMFTLAALEHEGQIDPIQAQVLSSGGLFATRANMFAKGSPYYRYMLANGYSKTYLDRLSSGKNAHETNFEAIMDEMGRMKVNPELKASMIQDYFHLSNPEQAMALATVKGQNVDVLQNLLKRSHVPLNQLKMSGIQTLADIANAGNMHQLQPVIESLIKRGILTGKNDAALNEAEGKSFSATQEYLASVAAKHGRERTVASESLRVQKELSTKMTEVGNKLFGPLTSIKYATMKMAGVGSESTLEHDIVGLHKNEIRHHFAKELSKYHILRDREAVASAALKEGPMAFFSPDKGMKAALDKLHHDEAEVRKIRHKRQVLLQAADEEGKKHIEAMNNAAYQHAKSVLEKNQGHGSSHTVHHQHSTELMITIHDKHGTVLSDPMSIIMDNGKPSASGSK